MRISGFGCNSNLGAIGSGAKRYCKSDATRSAGYKNSLIFK
jgi:hypothetical protein